MRLISKSVVGVVGHKATLICRNDQLCAGLAAGIEGAIHAMRKKWGHTSECIVPNASQTPLNQEPNREVELSGPDTPDPASMDEEDEDLISNTLNTQGAEVDQDGDGDDFFSIIMADAENGFNMLNRKAMLWTVRHLWAAGSRFSFNCYRHAAQLVVVRGQGQPASILLSREGVTQGDPLSMILYGVDLVPLIRLLKTEVPEAMQA